MQYSSIPAKFPVPFANAAGASYVRTIPADSQIGVTPGAASLADGFPPLNFLPLASGGVPPSGQDMNGILQQLSAWAQWAAAGNPVKYDAAFQTAVGGYPAGAEVLSATTPGLSWMSTTDNNTTNPDTGGAGWLAQYFSPAASIAASGYQKFSSGLLIQWGTVSIPGFGAATWTFPVTFPSACFGVLAMCNSAAGTSGPTSPIAATGLSTSSATIDFQSTSDVFSAFALALGH